MLPVIAVFVTSTYTWRYEYTVLITEATYSFKLEFEQSYCISTGDMYFANLWKLSRHRRQILYSSISDFYAKSKKGPTNQWIHLCHFAFNTYFTIHIPILKKSTILQHNTIGTDTSKIGFRKNMVWDKYRLT